MPLLAALLVGCSSHALVLDGGRDSDPIQSDGWGSDAGRDAWRPRDVVQPPRDHGFGDANTSCGPFPGGQCSPSMICDIHGCYPGASGTCQPKPASCAEMWAPVCGCDGVTYPNDCYRLMSGVPLQHQGSCASGNDAGPWTDAVLPPPPVCGPFPGGQCPYSMVCNIQSCYPGASGICLPKPSSCPKLWAPVCGCDNATYGNDCFRLLAGVPLKHQGQCAVVADAGSDGPVPPPPDAASPSCGPYPGGQCPSFMICNIQSCYMGASGTCLPKPSFCPGLWAPVCGCDGYTYANDCFRLQSGVALSHQGPCAVTVPDAAPPPPYDAGPPPSDASQTCLAGGCGSWAICDITGCGNTGVCVAKPVNCPFLWDPVCGCNYQTYANNCIRLLAGVALMHPGACSQDGGPD